MKKHSNKKYTKEEWVEKMVAIHGNKYGYERVVYLGAHIKVEIFCKECGIYFFQEPNQHARGSGCSLCKAKACSKLMQKTQEQFIQGSIAIHGTKYDYSWVVYLKNNLKVKIFCKECKEFFFQRPDCHLNGNGCPICKYKKISSIRMKPKIQFIEDSEKVHGTKYGYDEVDYKGNKRKVKIWCKQCKEYFYCSPHNHIQQKGGCPICNPSESKNEILCAKILREILDESYSITTKNRTILRNPVTERFLEIDIIIRKKEEIVLYIEWNGTYWHSFDSVIKKDLFKKQTLGNKLIQIEDAGSVNADYVKQMINTAILPQLFPVP